MADVRIHHRRETMTTTVNTTRTTRDEQLTEEMLEPFRARAAEADAANTYFHDDLEQLRAIGYLAAAVPEHHGGWGLDVARLANIQRRIAHYAPSTALAMCMHHYWVGIASELERMGDDSCGWILDEAVNGTVFAAGHAETGNDLPVVMSTATARRVDGGYRFDGRKMFGSNGPVWGYLGAHALDTSDPAHPVIVHGFVRRADPGVTVRETWDTLGMRPSQSHDTILDDVFVPDERIGRITPAGDESDPFMFFMNIWALGLFSNVYVGIAERALELAVTSATTKRSVVIPRGAYAHNPMVQHQVAEMFLELQAGRATLDRMIDDFLAGVDHGVMWGAHITSAKWRAVESAKRVVDIALDVSGGGGMFRGNELERLYRDVRCGGFHPANDALTHEAVAKAVLRIDPAGPRW
jgi:alkylation response protein AidB-like acyl-CoA dehydrogenase